MCEPCQLTAVTGTDPAKEVIHVFFEREFLKINILSVLALQWEEVNAYAVGRSYNALSFRVCGDADFTHDDQAFHVKSGDIIFVPKGYDYHLSAHNEELFVVHFEIENQRDTDIDLITPVDRTYFQNKFRTLYDIWTKKQIGYKYECTSVLYKILSKLYKQKYEHKIDAINDAMNDAIEYIHDHFTEPGLSISGLSALAGMSDTYFRRLFVSSFGITPLKYINNLRLSYAFELLNSGYFSISEIAEKCGFDNQKYFSTVVKKQTGKPPTYFKVK